MEVNILLIIAGLILLCNVMDGYKKGMVKSIISFVSLIVLCVVVALIGNGLRKYMSGDFISLVVIVLLLGIVGIVNHLLGVVFFSAKILSKLPVIHSADKLLGIVFGILKTVFLIWTTYTLASLFEMGKFETYLTQYTNSSRILLWFYENNYLAQWLQKIGVFLKR